MTLTVLDETRVGDVGVRWVRVGDVDIMVVSSHGLWVAGARTAGDRESIMGAVFGDGCTKSAELCATAFGMTWDALTDQTLAGQLALLDSVTDDVLGVLQQCEPEGLVAMRLTCPRPADVVRALTLMNDYRCREQ